MPVEQNTRPYDPAQDPGNPITTGMGWATIGLAAATIISAGITAFLGAYSTFEANPLKGILIAVAAMTATAITVFAAIVAQGRKELAQLQSAERIAVAKIEAATSLAIVKETGQAPGQQPEAQLTTPTTTTTTTTQDASP